MAHTQILNHENSLSLWVKTSGIFLKYLLLNKIIQLWIDYTGDVGLLYNKTFRIVNVCIQTNILNNLL